MWSQSLDCLSRTCVLLFLFTATAKGGFHGKYVCVSWTMVWGFCHACVAFLVYDHGLRLFSRTCVLLFSFMAIDCVQDSMHKHVWPHIPSSSSLYVPVTSATCLHVRMPTCSIHTPSSPSACLQTFACLYITSLCVLLCPPAHLHLLLPAFMSLSLPTTSCYPHAFNTLCGPAACPCL